MANPPVTSVQNLLPVQAYFDVEGNFQTFIGQGQPFYATVDPQQSGLNITNSTINSTTIGVTSPAVGYFTSGYVSVAPTTATGIANKQYVDYYAAGLSWKQPVKAASLSNIASLSGFQTIDTVPLTDGDRVLVKDQSLSKNNGIYVVRSGAWEYAVGADNWEEYVGAIVFVEEGSQAYSAWYSLAQEGGTLGVTALDWANFSVSSTYSAGTGLTLSAGVFSITNTGVINATYGSATASAVIAVNAQGQITSASNSTITPAVGSITGLGTGVATALAVNVGSSGSVLVNGGALGTPTSGDFSSGTFTWPTFNQNTTGTAAGLSATLAIASGGTGQTTASAAFNALSPITTTGDLIIGNGTNSATRLAIGSNNTVLTSNGTTASWVAGTSFMVYPGAGIPNSTGSAWGTSYSTTGSGTVVALATNPTLYNPNIDVIDFDTAYATALTAGQLGWDLTNNSLAYGMTGGNITQHIGEDQYLYIKASATITKGQVIMFTGSVGASGILTGAPATGLTDGTYIIGVAAESIANNAFGFVQTFGVLTNVNTASFNDGDILWYDPSVTGGLTATKPSAPNIKAQVAACNKGGSAGGGVITVRVNAGSSLGGTDSNVQITSPTGGQILSYNQTGQYWSNINLTAGTGISITPTTGGAITIANTVTGGITITDDTTTNATRYLTFTSATSGTITGENVSSTKLQYNPSTGLLTSTAFSGSGASLTSLSASNISSGTLSVANGGTGQTSLTANNVVLGNGTSAVQFVAPGTTGNVLTSNGTTWTSQAISTGISVTALIVAGGGGGGSSGTGGGGGGGGLTSSSLSLTAGAVYYITVGAGGTAGSYGSSIAPTIGGTSSIVADTLNASRIGGGRGGYWDIGDGGSGGSGGGGVGFGNAGGSGTVGQGNNGGAGTSGGSAYGSGGGGGAGGVGGAGTTTTGGAGGVGAITTLITTAQATSASVGQVVSSSVYFAGGGGGGRYFAAGGLGGSGGGGNAGQSSGAAGIAGTVNTGGGGGGGCSNGSNLPDGGAGGSGVVLLSIPTSSYTGTTSGSPTVVTNGSNTVLIFKSSGTYTA